MFTIVANPEQGLRHQRLFLRAGFVEKNLTAASFARHMWLLQLRAAATRHKSPIFFRDARATTGKACH